ncbi:MAG: hypothetical protein R2754_03170 [Microthrixaceae bacterium]
MADAAAESGGDGPIPSPDNASRRPPLLGRSPLRVIFRVAQVTLLLWAGGVLVERYISTSDDVVQSSGDPADLVQGDEVFSDGFDRSDGPLGASDDWDVVAGNWVVSSARAELVPDPSGSLTPGLATAALPDADRIVVQVTVDSRSDSVGLVYAYKGPDDFYRISFNPSFAAVGVEKIGADGAQTIERFGPVSIPETYEISLEFAQDEVQIWVGNVTLGQVTLENGELPDNFGLSSAAGSPAAFDDVKVFVGGG